MVEFFREVTHVVGKELLFPTIKVANDITVICHEWSQGLHSSGIWHSATSQKKRHLKYTVAEARDLYKRSNYFDAEYASN